LDFEQLVAMLRNPGEDGIPETIYDDLSASYTDATSTRDAKITTSGEELAAAQAEILRLKSHNYDLLMATGIDNSDDSGEDDSNDDSSDPDDIGDDEDFFEKKED